MNALYARVFVQILDSSIAENFTLRHVFEDLFKLCDYKTGVIDMTREALSRRLNIPLETLNPIIEKLESPDPNSRDSEFEGRRIERLDEHRNWGWRILNWSKYEEVRNRADVSMRVARHRANKESSISSFESFWSAYPRKTGKAAAQRSFERAIKNTTLDKMLLSLELQKRSQQWQKNNGQFVPHPATWLNQGRWDDELTTGSAPTADSKF